MLAGADRVSVALLGLMVPLCFVLAAVVNQLHESRTTAIEHGTNLSDNVVAHLSLLEKPVVYTSLSTNGFFEKRSKSVLDDILESVPFPIYSNVQQQKMPLFIHSTPGMHPHWKDLAIHNTVNVSIRDILRPREGMYRYWSGPADELGPIAADAVRGLLCWMMPSCTHGRDKEEEEEGDVGPIHNAPNWNSSSIAARRAWLSSPGVLAALHYDAYQNRFLQVHGSKQFYLAPPEVINTLLVFPSLHPQYRQCQDLDILLDSSSIHHHFLRRVSLVPGEALHLPPFWLHGVRSDKETVSINTWIKDPVIELAEKIFTDPVPFEDDWSLQLKAHALRQYVLAICKRLHVSSDNLAQTLARRFALQPSGEWKYGSCEKSDEVSSADQNWYQRLEDGADRVWRRLFGLKSPVVRMYLEDLVEEMVTFFFGPEKVVPFAQQCIAGDALI